MHCICEDKRYTFWMHASHNSNHYTICYDAVVCLCISLFASVLGFYTVFHIAAFHLSHHFIISSFLGECLFYYFQNIGQKNTHTHTHCIFLSASCDRYKWAYLCCGHTHAASISIYSIRKLYMHSVHFNQSTVPTVYHMV